MKADGIVHSTPVSLGLDGTVGLCLGPYGGPRVEAVSYERGTPASGAFLNMVRQPRTLRCPVDCFRPSISWYHAAATYGDASLILGTEFT